MNKEIPEEVINKAFGNANFGSIPKKEVIIDTLEKIAQGYHSGHTAMCIVKEIGLIHSSRERTVLSEKGINYLKFVYVEPLQKELKEASEGYLKTIQSWVKLAERQAARIQELESELQELKEENDLKERQLIAATSRIKLLDEEIERLKAGDRILFELVQLKHIKDVYGKTEDYERDQPLLWEKARKYFIQSQSEVVEIDSADKKAAGDYAHETENKVAHIKTALFTGFLDGVRYERGRGGEEKMETEQQPEGKIVEVYKAFNVFAYEEDNPLNIHAFIDWLEKKGYKLLQPQVEEGKVEEGKFYCRVWEREGYKCEQQCDICNKADNCPDLPQEEEGK
jgi:molybdopterin converting factor small subunit